MPVVAVADMYGVSGRRAELVRLLADLETQAVARPGCLRYAFTETIAEPDHFVLLSEWADQASLDSHYESREFASFQFALNGLLARPSELTVHVVSVSARPTSSGPMDPRDAD